MERSITVKAKTIEEAVGLGVSILDVGLKEVDIEVLANPGRSLFGLRKNEAEVRVTTRVKTVPDQSIEESNLEGVVNGVLNSSEQSLATTERLMESVQSKAGARILNSKIELLFSGKGYPVIEPRLNVRLFVNQEKVEKRVVVKPHDEVTVKVSDELIPPFFSVKLIEQDMLAMISVIPGKKVIRALFDTDYEEVLQVEAEEYIEYYNDIDPQTIVNELKLLGVQKGLIFSEIKNATEVEEETEGVIAKGIQPIEGLDGDLVMHVGIEDGPVDELAPIDFRESSGLLTVTAGERIATHIPATAGKDGHNLLGKLIPAKKVNEITIRTGENVEIVGHDIVAKIAGKPVVERRNRHVKIDVYKEFVHNGEVDLKSGNIRFDGDVRIGGNIHPSMFVTTSGTIFIGGSVTKATIHSAKAVTVGKNVFTSTISVGKQKHILGELAISLEEILIYLEQLRDAVKQILLVRGAENEDLTAAELNHLIRLLLEKKYTMFQELNKSFIQKVKNHSMELPVEWVQLANKFYEIFIHTMSEELKDAVGLELLIAEAWVLVEMYSVEPEPKSVLSVPYAINSELYCNGDIVITSKGLYHSFVKAGNNVSVNGVCRGGEIFGGNQVILHQSGSENMVKTVVKTGAAGSVRIGHAYAGTEVYVGSQKHIFKRDRVNAYIKLNENGDLDIE